MIADRATGVIVEDKDRKKKDAVADAKTGKESVGACGCACPCERSRSAWFGFAMTLECDRPVRGQTRSEKKARRGLESKYKGGDGDRHSVVPTV